MNFRSSPEIPVVGPACPILFNKYEEINMATGTVKWFNNDKGFGFIVPDEGGADIFVHISAVERAGMRTLNEGQKLSYQLQSNPKNGKMSAGDLQDMR
jgi:cold shock protein